ncbi:MAG: ComEA family DNA-binding protein [Corynebacterium sp.]|nr:ComEA family DNA-binding protein [Corynebacterium sp.]
MTLHSHPTDRIAELTRPTGDEEILRVRFREPHLTIPRRGAITAGILCALVLLLWLIVSRPDQPTPLTEPASLTLSVAPTVTPTPTEIVVAVVGEVATPGLVTLPAGARAADALAAAGVHPDANLAAINLAQKLTDGVQLVVPAPGEPVPADADAGAGGGGAISLNQATAADLETLSGVGAKTAAAIIAYRDSIGGFSAIDQLLEVKGIGPAKFDQIKDSVTL